MKITDIFKQKKPLISFEVFPPKESIGLDTLYSTIASLQNLHPDFISVTYGAAGGTKDMTVDIASTVKAKYNITSLAHLTCLGSTREQLDEVLKALHLNEISNILALRGDPPITNSTQYSKGDFRYAFELIEYIKSTSDFCVGGACYPEGHTESQSKIQDLHFLKNKVEAGLDFLITQLFFDNEIFYLFLEKLSLLKINIPVIAGILPVLNANQLKRIQQLSGCSLPKKFTRIIEKYSDNPQALAEAGIAYAAEQIVDLLSYGVDGIHIYTMNKPHAAQNILSNIENIRRSVYQKLSS